MKGDPKMKACKAMAPHTLSILVAESSTIIMKLSAQQNPVPQTTKDKTIQEQLILSTRHFKLVFLTSAINASASVKGNAS
jgi:hypothetical protein